ncbi:hypothetical protein HHS34_005430 [Acidithiobacillus montserratensis]|uniref:Uncharacterized protein n=1 Tax=Acidithiobacillus montserratensis TaxID=2729135 RepID=A0ACD5HIM2_9PROT|nr:hypothetical protein [Acidithiobacillus montserratensis]MBU2749390.1 hypothetical protein [Acidithiobacillus montserratensis]
MMSQENKQSLYQRIENAHFTTLSDGTILYRPSLSKDRYIVPDENLKLEIIKALRIRRSILMVMLSLVFAINIITRDSNFSLIATIAIGMVGLIILINGARKFCKNMKLYHG